MSGIVLVWVIGGLFSGAGALTLAELGAMLPRAGGLYVYLRVAYGALPAFLFGWVEFLDRSFGVDGDAGGGVRALFRSTCTAAGMDSQRALAGGLQPRWRSRWSRRST